MGCFSGLLGRTSRSKQIDDMAEKTHSDMGPPSYSAPSSSPHAASDKDVGIIEAAVDDMSSALRDFSLKMHDFAEIALKEYKTHDLLAGFMKDQGFKVTKHAYGMETAVEAVYEHGKGGRTLGFNSEMDALPGIGHACGHNLIAIAGIAAAVATAKALKKGDIAGKVVLLGTPAEEDIGGKITLLKRGAYKGMDACLMIHPAPFGGLGIMLAITEVEVTYHGHPAHAAGAPWEAVNALDAAVLAYTNISALRQQVHPTERVHGIIKGSERWSTNVIPDYAVLSYGIRAPLRADMEKLRDRVYDCFKAAALATGCKMEMKETMVYSDLRSNSLLGDEYKRYMEDKQGIDVPSSIPSLGSTDFGDVSYAVPALHPLYAIPTKPGSGNHTRGFTKAAATPEAHKATLASAKGIAVAGWRVLTDKDFADKVKKEYDEMQA